MSDNDDTTPAQYASPPCFMHELDPAFQQPLSDWSDVRRWRKAERERLIAARLAISADARTEMANRIAEGRTGRLVVGCVGSATYSLLPALARALRTELPDVEFGFQGEMLSPDQITALHEETIDLGLLRPLPDLSELTVTPVRRERLLVAVPAEHRFATRRRLRVADLEGEGLIVHAGGGHSAMNAMVQDLFAGAGLEADIVHEVGETSTLVTFVAAGLGLAIVPEPTAALAVPGISYITLVGTPGADLIAATRADDDNPVLPRALDLLAELAGSSPAGTT